jgi:hypothetical protein
MPPSGSSPADATTPAPPNTGDAPTPHRLAPAPASIAHPARRELFWQNVVREMLTGLAAAAAASGGRLSAGPAGAATGASPVHELFDGRMAVITRLGQRIPIADVVPLFACSISTPKGSDPAQRSLSADVQCTVFQITTPNGEVHTLPVHEISSIHALSEQLLQRMQHAAAEAQGLTGPQSDGKPFGFAAFTSLARAEQQEEG